MVFGELWARFKSNFRNNPDQDAVVYLIIVSVAMLFSIVCIFAPLLTPICGLPKPQRFPYRNPLYNDDPCLRVRYGTLLGMTPTDADVGRRMIIAIALASLIGYERRSPDRPAGIRTMAVTALGSCCFTISSIFAFESGTMGWDASRVTAAIPAGVGFLGSALIFRECLTDNDGDHHVVTGISTAASVWISAAIGVASGGALFYSAVFTTFCAIVILRFGPREHEVEREGLGIPPPEEPEPVKESTPLLLQIMKQRLVTSPQPQHMSQSLTIRATKSSIASHT